ncbi:MAG: hypothetical protein M5T61_08710 [Acidimicrobiia bacterium]|nr:hypothetical protein [Acidimicrobiia bacterium]
MDHRAVFFLVASATCVALWPLAPSDTRWVNEWLAATYVVLAIASLADFVSRRRETGSADGDDPPAAEGSE